MTKTASRKKKQRRNDLIAYAMLAPDLIGLFVFIFVPIVLALYISFFSWNALSPMQFVGLRNYFTVFRDREWWLSVGRTLQYTAFFVSFVYVGALSIALLITSLPGRVRSFFRTAVFVPFSVSLVVAGIIWMFILEEQRGFANSILRAVGIPAQNYLSNPNTALLWIAVVSSWLLVGYYTIIFVAGIGDIPRSYYEAAEIDGARPWTVFFRITLPQLRHVSVFVLVMTTIASFQVFDQIKVMTNGGPASATTVSVFYIYRQAFEYIDLGYSSALAFVLFVMVFGGSLLQLSVFAPKEND